MSAPMTLVYNLHDLRPFGQIRNTAIVEIMLHHTGLWVDMWEVRNVSIEAVTNGTCRKNKVV
jgi:hypothetical protein